MANGDAAAAAFGWVPIAPTDDIRLGYDRINQLADYLAAADYAAFNIYSDTASAASAGFNAQTGFKLNSLTYSKLGKRISLTADVTKITSAATVGSDGDIGNLNLFSIPVGIKPAQSNGIISAGSTGSMKNGYVSSGGFLVLTAVSPNATLAVNDNFNIDALWHL